MKLNWEKSEQVEGTFEAKTNVTLVGSPSEKVLENSNGTKYQVCTVELENNKQVSAIIYTKNVELAEENGGLEIGKKYLAKAIYNPKRGKEVLIQMSHLLATERASIEDLGFEIPIEKLVENEFSRI